eukprot:TRINITY_DN5114_c0_g1_i1.p2 TRINITY_DN5114_c0_g1~~TRINITY_DN5114_c0_g1_i1.p2  ORF type:complete len:148 (+),score=67.75 TRINITY_DN5114_c0_g1_i1:69-446(+)
MAKAQREPEERAEIVRIIEEGIWAGTEGSVGVREQMQLHTDKRRLFLEEHVLPVLVPALQELLAAVIEKQRAAAQGFADGSPLNPIDWLAQYLMRNNPKYSRRLDTHPYVTLIKDHVRQVKAAVP